MTFDTFRTAILSSALCISFLSESVNAMQNPPEDTGDYKKAKTSKFHSGPSDTRKARSILFEAFEAQHSKDFVAAQRLISQACEMEDPMALLTQFFMLKEGGLGKEPDLEGADAFLGSWINKGNQDAVIIMLESVLERIRTSPHSSRPEDIRRLQALDFILLKKNTCLPPNTKLELKYGSEGPASQAETTRRTYLQNLLSETHHAEFEFRKARYSEYGREYQPPKPFQSTIDLLTEMRQSITGTYDSRFFTIDDEVANYLTREDSFCQYLLGLIPEVKADTMPDYDHVKVLSASNQSTDPNNHERIQKSDFSVIFKTWIQRNNTMRQACLSELEKRMIDLKPTDIEIAATFNAIKKGHFHYGKESPSIAYRFARLMKIERK